MNTEYEDLDLNGLLELSRSDAEHAGDMAEQARVMRDMSQLLRDNVDLISGAMRTLFGGDDAETQPAAWNGSSSDMMRVELNRLFESFRDAPEVMEQNATTMDDLGTRAHNTLVRIDQLHVQSAGGTGEGGEADTAEARRIMREANSGYMTSAQQMGEPSFYNGLRESAPDDSSPDWTEPYAATPGAPPEPTDSPAPQQEPAAQQPVDQPTGPQLQSGPAPTGAPPPPAAPAPAPGPTATPTPIMVTPPAPAPTAPAPVRPAPPGLTPRPRPTVPPVIGGRGGGTPPPSRPVPGPNQTVRPVIGTRPTTPPATVRPGMGTPPGARPVGEGVVRPVIGSRGAGAVEGAPTRPAANPNGLTRPVIGSRGTGVAPSAGTGRPAAAPGQNGAFRPTARTVPPVIGSRPASGGTPARPVGGKTTGGPTAKGAAPRPTTTTGRVPGIAANPRAYSTTGQRHAIPSSTDKATARPKAKPPAGQRVKPVVRRPTSPALERAILRGAAPAPSNGPGQEAFARFDRAKAATEARRHPKATERDSDDPWFVGQDAVDPVIGRRGES